MAYRRSEILMMDDSSAGLLRVAKELSIGGAAMMATTELRNAVLAHLAMRGELVEDDGSQKVGTAGTSSAASSVASKPAQRGIFVTNTVYERTVQNYGGKTVGDLHRALRDPWSIEAQPRIYLTRAGTTSQVEMTACLEDGDRVEFMKTSAEKGRS